MQLAVLFRVLRDVFCVIVAHHVHLPHIGSGEFSFCDAAFLNMLDPPVSIHTGADRVVFWTFIIQNGLVSLLSSGWLMAECWLSFVPFKRTQARKTNHAVLPYIYCAGTVQLSISNATDGIYERRPKQTRTSECARYILILVSLGVS